jgi:flagellar hook-associated protein 2
MSTIQRITGTNSGLDVDTLVKTAMTPYQTKIDKEVQNQKVLQYQQEQYKQIISDSSNFYDKYFDILKSGNIMSTSAYQTETFTSTDGSKVTAKGLAGASLDNYTVSVTQLAAKASDSLSSSTTGDQKITIGTAEIHFQATADGNTTTSNYNSAVSKMKSDLSTKVTAGTASVQEKAQLADLNNNTITAKYSEFSKNITFTASAFGGSGFTLNSNVKAEDKYLEATIKNSSGTVYNISSIDKKTSNSVTIDNIQFDFKGVSTATTSTSTSNLISNINAIDPATIGGDVNQLTELTALAEDGTTTTSTATDGTKTTVTTSGTGRTTTRLTTSSGDTTTTTTDTSKPGITSVMDKSGVITTTDTSGADTITTIKAGTTTTTTKTKADGTIPITKRIETSGTTTTTTTTLKNGATTTVKKDVYDGTNTVTTTTNEEQGTDGSTTTVAEATNGTTTNTTTTQLKVGSDGTTTKTVRINGANNQQVTTCNTPTSLTGSTDISGLKDKIVKFVSDYNTLLQSINTKIFETRDKDYMPLTDEQKKSMSADQIKAWETKAQTGLLRKDNDLQRITSAMKSAMSSVMSGSGLYLEKIGISPVKNYADKNGMLTVDEDKLTQALEGNAGDVKDLFTRSASTTDNQKGGVLTQLKSALYSEFKTSTSSLSKKVGLVGTSTEYNNTLSLSIYNKKQSITQLNSSLTDKENALYKKYSNLETALQTLNSQQASLTSMLK